MSATTPKTENGLQDNTPARQAIAQDGRVLPFVLGRGRVAVQWITPVLHWNYRSTKTSSYAFVSAIGQLCLGPVDEIARVYVNGKPYTGPFAFRDASPGDWFEHVLAKETPETFRFYWGTETQSAADITAYAQSLVRSPGHPEAAAIHPAYRGRVLVGVKDLEAGQASSGFTPPLPNIEVEVYRRAPIAYSFGHCPHGTHPVGAAYELLTDRRGGIGLPLSLFDSGDWTAKLNRLMDEGASGKKGYDLFISPVWAEQREASQALADVLSYFDGWLSIRNGKISVDWYPNDGTTIDPADLAELSIHSMIGEPTIDPDGLKDLVSKVSVEGLDWQDPDDPLCTATEVAQVSYASEIIGEARPEKISRPFFLTREQLRNLAAVTALIRASPRLTVSAKWRRETCVQPDDVTPLVPGDRFQFDYAPFTLDVVCRVLERTESDDKAEVTLKFITERGASPQPYVPPLDPRATIELPDPEPASHFAVVEAPSGLELPAGPSVIVLAERPNTYTAAWRLHFAPTNSFPGEIILDDSKWAISGVVSAGLTNVSTPGTLTVTIASDEIGDLVSQGATEQENNTLFLYAGGEWLSVGTISPLGGGSYDIGVLRGCVGSSTRAILTTERVYLIYREDVPSVAHANFLDVGVPYNSTTATKYFKLEAYTGIKDAAISSAVSLQFANRAPAVPTGLTATGVAGGVYFEWTNPTSPDFAYTNLYVAATSTKPGSPTYKILGLPGAKSSFTVELLSAGDVRHGRVNAVDKTDIESLTDAGPANATALSPTAGTDGYTFEQDEVNFVQCDSAGTAKAGELGGSGRVRSIFKVFKGTTALAATGGVPIAGQFRVAKILDTGCTTTYSGGYVIELTTISAASGNTEYKIELEGTSVFIQSKYHWNKTLDGTAGSAGVSPPGFWAQSTSTVTIGTGSKVFNIGAGYGYFAGMRAKAIDQANSANWVEGLITGYSSPNLTILVDLISGSGTKSAWNIGVSGEIGQTGTTGPTGPTGGTGATGSGYGGTSTSSNSIGTGSKAFTIGTGYAYVVGSRVRVASTASPSNWVEGIVASYTSGVLTLTSDITGGSGTFSLWTVTIAGDLGPTGATGVTGAAGDTGPGIVFRGAYSGAGTYFQTTTRRDVVLHSSTYYLVDNPAKSGLATWSTPGVADWTTFGATFSSVATDWLLAGDQTVLRTLTMGDGTTSNAGVIRSAGASAFGTGNGFWQGYDGTTAKWRVGNPAGYFMSHDGTDVLLNSRRVIIGDSGGANDTVGDLQVVGEISNRKFGSGTQNTGFTGTLAGGTIASPTATQAGSFVALRFRGHTGSAYASAGSIRIKAASTWSGSGNPTEIEFVVNSGSGSKTAYINKDGKIEFDTRDNANLYQPAANTVKTDGAFVIAGVGLGVLDSGGTYDHFNVTQGAYVRVQGVNFLLYNSGGTQMALIDNLTGDYYRQGTKVLGARQSGFAGQSATPSGSDLGSSPTTLQIASYLAKLDGALKTHGILGT